MTSIDIRDAEVQQQFTAMRKSSRDSDKEILAEQISTMYETNEQYSYGIFTRIIKFISESNDKQEKKIGLITLASIASKMQGTARSIFVNKFHSPVFKLMETNTDEQLIPYIEKAYEIVMEIGGNRNDSAIESNLVSCLSILDNSNTKDIRKIGIFSILKILIRTSPYITFKKFFQKIKNSNMDNFHIITTTSRSKNIKLRSAFLYFLEEYIKYIAEKKDNSYQKTCIEKLFDSISITHREASEQLNHLYIETVNLILQFMPHNLTPEMSKNIIQYCLDKIQHNKNPIIQRSLIKLVPKIAQKKPSDEIVITFLRYLRSLEGEVKIYSFSSINLILEATEKRSPFLEIHKNILEEILNTFKAMCKKAGSASTIQLALLHIKSIDILIKKYKSQEHVLVSEQTLNELISYALIVGLDHQITKLIADIIKFNIHGLGKTLEIQFIITISKILTGSTRKVLRDVNQEFKFFMDLLDSKEPEELFKAQINKVKAIEALSLFRFRQQFREIIGGFVRDCVLKQYLERGNSKMKMAAVEAAFFLHPKKGKNIASNQILQILEKLLRVGNNDEDPQVRQKVFGSIVKNFKRHEEFIQLFSNVSLLNTLFKALEDRSQKIRLETLKILCILYKKNPSMYITPYLNQYLYRCFYHLSSNFKYYPQKCYLIKSVVVIIQYAPSIIANHIDNLLALLLNYLSDQNNYDGLQELFFELVKTLAIKLPNTIVPYAQQFSHHLVRSMKDKLNTHKRQAALKTFLSIIKECGYVVIPYFQIPSLKATLAFLIRSQIEQESRIDIMKIIGALGAFDQIRFGIIQEGAQGSSNQAAMVKSLKRLNTQSSFFILRDKLLKDRENKMIDRKLKEYYDQLILQHNSKRFALLNSLEATPSHVESKDLSSSQKIELEVDSSMNFHMIILKVLFQILSDQSLEQKHTLTLEVLTQLIDLMGSDLQKELPKIMEVLLKLIPTNQQILILIHILGERCDISMFIPELTSIVLNHCQNIFTMIKILSLITGKYHMCLRHLVEAVVDRMHQIVQNNFNDSKLIIEVSLIYQNMIPHLEPYLNLIIPQIVDKYFKKNSQITNAFIDFLMNLAKSTPAILQFMPLITYALSNLLSLCQNKHSLCKPCLRNKICNCIVLFIVLFKSQFVIYLPMLHKGVLKNDDDMHELYFKAVRYLDICTYGNITSIFSEDDLEKINPEYRGSAHPRIEPPRYTKKVDGVEQLIHQFDPIGKKIIEEDWVQWLKKNSILLLKKSPNTLLRTCSVLADEYNELGLELYNISFYFFWEVLIDDQKKMLIDNIKSILQYNPKPFLLVRKTFLELAEFMNRKKCAFELSSNLLAQCAGSSSSFAKQLYYKEQQFQANPQRTIQSMIDTYMKLGEPENAFGLFEIAKTLDIKCKTQWYQKIGKYEEAYKAYIEQPEQIAPNQKLKCLNQISDEKFIQEYQKLCQNSMVHISNETNHYALEAYSHLQEWDNFQLVMNKVEEEGYQKSFWSSILDIKKQNYEKALTDINQTRKLLYEDIPDLTNFSATSEAFEKLITLQQLFELEEIVSLKQRQQKLSDKMLNMDEAEKVKVTQHFNNYTQRLKETWKDRLIGCYKSSLTYKKLTTVRSLLFSEAQSFDFYYGLCEIYIKEKKVNKGMQLIQKIKKYMEKNHIDAKLQLIKLLQIKLNFSVNHITSVQSILKIQKFLGQNEQLHPQKIGQIYYLAGLTLYQNNPDNRELDSKILGLIQKSAILVNSYREWYIFSFFNIEFAEHIDKPELVEKYVINALNSLINTLKNNNLDSQFYLQTYLKLLQVLCQYSKLKAVYSVFESQYKYIPVEGWINVVPQMMAQLYQNQQTSPNFMKILKVLLKQLGEQHPQSVLFSLFFAIKSKIPERVKPAQQIIDHIRLTHSKLADEVYNISSQLVRAAIKLKQYWYDSVESAWANYNQTKNTVQVIAVLKELCQTVFNRKQSNSEISFHQEFGQDIRDGYNWLLRFEKTNQPVCLSQVFEIFYNIYKKVKDTFESIKKIYLKNVAPFLVTSKTYQSCIPGIYEPHKNCVKVTGFCNQLTILQSKQRPRKLTIYGDDGKQYNFLLKGREDLRLDERVMQFFSLVNKLLSRERQNLRRDLQITRYSIVPLTVNTGLIGWVQNCDTLNELIKQFRTLNKIRIYVEKQLYEKTYPDYAYLPVINKLQIFKTGLQYTQGKDLQRILWMKSPNSQAWIQKRNNYTCSLATMSIVGYILGLGDRHPSNIMLNRNTAKIVHIDFGDCFEVASLRQKFPERVPFRLTRMLQKAMGVPGIHGLFRFTCQKVMRILRDNKQSLYGVLETFAQDPIISWRLTNQNKEEKQVTHQTEAVQNINEQAIDQIMSVMSSQINTHKEVDEESPRRSIQADQNKQQINEKAIKALERVKHKLKGNEFNDEQLIVEKQVNKLIQEATSAINICQSWPGWCPFW